MLNARNKVVVDIETTGLNPHHEEILEIALVVTDPLMINELAYYQTCLYYSDVERLRSTANDFVRNMHDVNGLWEALRNPANCRSLERVGYEARCMVEEYCGAGVKAIAAGKNVESFDLAFIKAWLPELATAFHHRTINISSYREMLKDEGIVLENEGAEAHRALQDCRDTIKLYQACRAAMSRSVRQAPTALQDLLR